MDIIVLIIKIEIRIGKILLIGRRWSRVNEVLFIVGIIMLIIFFILKMINCHNSRPPERIKK